MNKRKILVYLLVLVGLTGLLFAAAPFVRSLGPAEHLSYDGTDIDLSGFQPNSTKMVITRESKKVESGNSTAYSSGEALLAIRGEKNDYYLYRLPIWENKVLMPYHAWGQYEGLCPKLQLGKVKHNAPVIYCQNPDGGEFLTKQWYWSVEGKNLGDDLPDLVPVRFRISAGVMHAFWR